MMQNKSIKNKNNYVEEFDGIVYAKGFDLEKKKKEIKKLVTKITKNCSHVRTDAILLSIINHSDRHFGKDTTINTVYIICELLFNRIKIKNYQKFRSLFINIFRFITINYWHFYPSETKLKIIFIKLYLITRGDKKLEKLSKKILRIMKIENFDFLTDPLIIRYDFLTQQGANPDHYVENLLKINKKVEELIDISTKALLNENSISVCKKCSSGNNKLFFFKKFNSVYPAAIGNNIRGGGFFIKWNNKGIVIDPGYNFYRQFNERGFTVNDIDYILVTHSHDDHCTDLEAIFSILFKTNKNCKKNKKIYLFGSHNVIRKYSFLQSFNQKYAYFIKKNSNCKKVNEILKKSESGFKIQTTDAFHNEEPLDSAQGGSSVGISVTLINKIKNIRILFSGDTSFDMSLIKQYYDLNPDYLVLNIGKIEENIGYYYAKHLGIKGCKTIISQLTQKRQLPKAVFITEFGYEMKEQRIQITNLIKEWVKIENFRIKESVPHILPADNNLELYLKSSKIYDQSIQKTIPIKSVKFKYADETSEDIQYYL